MEGPVTLSSIPPSTELRVIPEPSELMRGLVQKVPLAQAVLAVLRFVVHATFLDKLYDKFRGQCYEDQLSFPTLVQLISDALLQYHGSGRQAIHEAQKNKLLPCQPRAVYDKLKRLPLPLSMGFLRETSATLRDMLPLPVDNPLPACFAEFEVGILDGKKLKNVAKRLLVTRGQPGKVYGSLLLTWYDPVAHMIRGLEVNRDGEANENALVVKLLAFAHSQLSAPRLWLCDALYCDLVQITLYRSHGDHFVLRQHPKLSFHADPERPARDSYDPVHHRRLREEWGWVGAANDKRRCYVRRVHWLREDGQKSLVVITDLTDADKYSAAAVLALYLHRWSIETVFQEITELFNLRKLIGCTPEAVTFQAVFCMVIYNIVQLVKAYVAQVGPPQPMPVDDVSTKMLFTTMSRELQGLAVLATPSEIMLMVPTFSTPAMIKEWLGVLLHGCWDPLWRKARNKTKRKYGPKPKGQGSHTSVHRLQQKHAEHQKRSPPPTGDASG